MRFSQVQKLRHRLTFIGSHCSDVDEDSDSVLVRGGCHYHGAAVRVSCQHQRTFYVSHDLAKRRNVIKEGRKGKLSG